jgi:hypothetical protein
MSNTALLDLSVSQKPGVSSPPFRPKIVAVFGSPRPPQQHVIAQRRTFDARRKDAQVGYPSRWGLF